MNSFALGAVALAIAVLVSQDEGDRQRGRQHDLHSLRGPLQVLELA